MEILRIVGSLFGPKQKRRVKKRARPTLHRVRPQLEELEERAVPATWMDGSGDHLWTNSANWQNNSNPYTPIGPAPAEDVQFLYRASPLLGSNDYCIIPAGVFVQVDIVDIQDTYTGTIYIEPGATLEGTNELRVGSASTLKLNYLPSGYPTSGTGPAVAETNVNFYIYGQVLATDDGSGDSSYIKGNIFVELGGSITAVVNANDTFGLGPTPPVSLAITGPILDEAIINIGQPGAGMPVPGWLQTSGTVTIDVDALVTMYPSSDWEATQLTSGDTFVVKGTIDMQELGVGVIAPWGATMIDNPGLPVLLNLGTLNVDDVAPEYVPPPLMTVPGLDVITGDLYNVDSSNIYFISTGGAIASSLTVQGDYSQATAYGASATPGILNMRIGGAGFGNDSLEVDGVATLGGTLNVLPGGGTGGSPWALIDAAAFATNGSGIPYDFALVNLYAGTTYVGLGVVV